MTTKTLDLNNIERKIFWALTASLGIVLGFYLYSVLSLTLAVVARDSTVKAAHELANTAGSLEAEYLAETNGVTLAYAESLGFHEVSAKYTGSGVAVAVANTNGVKLSMAR
ncbi:MAG: hypothetical protein WC791_04275 [Candidatus Paceibacterota bacterium]|jgi:hypothetical protein